MSATECDYLIIGGGAAGCVLARRLSEDPNTRVLLAEAGGRDRNPLFHIPAGFAKMTKGIASWGWSTTPQKGLNGRALWYTQARIIGGGSSINAQVYARGSAHIYDEWESVYGCEGWNYKSLLPYFKRAEGNDRFENAYHGGEGPLGVSMPRGMLPICDAFLRAAQQWGMPFNPDFNGRELAGCGLYQLTQRDARRSSAARDFLRPAESRPNLTVLTGTQARRLTVEGGRVTGAELMRGGSSMRARAGREVILACGSIGSPRLLLLSGIGPAEHLREVGVEAVHDLPGVGENLQDHLALCVLSECTGRHTYDGMDRLDRMLLAGLQYYLTRTGPATSSLFQVGGFWRIDSETPNMQFHFGLGTGIEKGIVKIDGCGATLNCSFVQPRSRGRVRLASADDKDAPLIDPNFWGEPGEREISLRGLEMAREIMGQPALRPYIRKEIRPGAQASRAEIEEYAIGIAKTDHHPVGTCKMGRDDMAVVDTQLKLRGLEGLRVCDASVIPRITTSNTCAAAIMVAERGADLIRGHEPLPPAVLGAGG